MKLTSKILKKLIKEEMDDYSFSNPTAQQGDCYLVVLEEFPDEQPIVIFKTEQEAKDFVQKKNPELPNPAAAGYRVISVKFGIPF